MSRKLLRFRFQIRPQQMTSHRDAPFSACTGFIRDIRQAGYTPDIRPNSTAIARP